jgi:hypothetical protein
MKKLHLFAVRTGGLLAFAFLCSIPEAAQAWPTAAVPEPGTLALLALGLSTIGALRFGRRGK